MVQAVSDVGSNAEENIAHAAKVIGKSSHRRSVFDAVYTGKRKIKTVQELIRVTKLPHRRVLDAGKLLASNRLLKAIKQDGRTGYEKIDFFHSHKRKILSLAASPKKLQAFPTKRNPAPQPRVVRVQLSTRRAKVTHLTVDDIDSFSKVKKVGIERTEVGDDFSETEFKIGLQRILGEVGKFKDWGGEVADLFTTRFRVGGKRRLVAIALKGPATKGKLTPGKMGKNGDQIQRLFGAPADVFLIQYCREVDLAVPHQMKQLAFAKSLLSDGAQVFWGVIDGRDSRRLVRAYPGAFRRHTKAAQRTAPSRLRVGSRRRHK